MVKWLFVIYNMYLHFVTVQIPLQLWSSRKLAGHRRTVFRHFPIPLHTEPLDVEMSHCQLDLPDLLKICVWIHRQTAFRDFFKYLFIYTTQKNPSFHRRTAFRDFSIPLNFQTTMTINVFFPQYYLRDFVNTFAFPKITDTEHVTSSIRFS